MKRIEKRKCDWCGKIFEILVDDFTRMVESMMGKCNICPKCIKRPPDELKEKNWRKR